MTQILKQVKSGGKLYLAGEYAILTPGQAAIIKFIPIYMTATIKSSNSYQLFSDMFDYGVDRTPDSNYSLIQETVNLFEDYLSLTGQSFSPFQLDIRGKLEEDGKKFGLGSSGSVVVLSLRALASHYNVSLSQDRLFKLACLVLLKRGDNGSMGDLAAIVYEDLVYYRSFNRQKIALDLERLSLAELLAQDWAYEIKVIKATLAFDFLVGWTKEPAISKDMINQVKSAIDQDFLDQTQIQVDLLYQALLAGDQELLGQALETISYLLENLHPAIYTPALQLLKAGAQGLDGLAKSSGSGGGDCGIALAFTKEASQQVIANWQAAGISLLYQEKGLL